MCQHVPRSTWHVSPAHAPCSYCHQEDELVRLGKYMNIKPIVPCSTLQKQAFLLRLSSCVHMQVQQLCRLCCRLVVQACILTLMCMYGSVLSSLCTLHDFAVCVPYPAPKSKDVAFPNLTQNGQPQLSSCTLNELHS